MVSGTYFTLFSECSKVPKQSSTPEFSVKVALNTYQMSADIILLKSILVTSNTLLPGFT